MARNSAAEATAEMLAFYADKPIEFIEDVLKRKLRPWQREAILAFVRRRRVSVRSAHGCGKTFCIAFLILWLIVTHQEVVVVCTAPTFKQLKNVVFRTLDNVRKHSPIASLIDMQTTKAAFGSSFAIGVTARDPEGAAGYHPDEDFGGLIVLIVDEASGVEEAFFDTFRGALTSPDAYVWYSGNPTRLQGRFYETFTKSKEFWHTIKVSAYDIPEIAEKTTWIQEMANDYGEDSDVFRVRVLGEFPTTDGDCLVPLPWLEDAKLVSKTPHQKLMGATDGYVIGVDVAWSGPDSSFVTVRRGNFFLAEYFAQFHGMGTTELAGYVTQLYETLLAMSPQSPNSGSVIRPVACVDIIGIGAGVYSTLHENKINARKVDVRELAPDYAKPKCHRLRDYLYWQLREMFNPENDIDPVILVPEGKPDKEKLADRFISECAAMTYSWRVDGRLIVEDKDHYKARNDKRSPDAIDSGAMTFQRENRVPRRKVVDIFERSRRRQQAAEGWFR